jgi:hypothetical protein
MAEVEKTEHENNVVPEEQIEKDKDRIMPHIGGIPVNPEDRKTNLPGEEFGVGPAGGRPHDHHRMEGGISTRG